MANANPDITTEVISDYVAGRLDPADARVIEEAIDHDEVVATAVTAARQVNSRMTRWFDTSMRGVSRRSS